MNARQFADVLEMNGGAPGNMTVGAGGSGGSITANGFQWSKSGGGIAFEVDLPNTKSGAGIFNQLGVIVIDATDVIVHDTGTVDVGDSNADISVQMTSNTRAVITPNLLVLPAGQYFVSVYGKWKGISDKDSTENNFPIGS